MLLRVALLTVLSWAAVLTGDAPAQDYPAKAIRWVVPAPPGSNNDILARIVAQHLSAAVGQPVVIDNRPGAGAVVGTDNVAKSPPDGYTILMTPSGFAINAALYRKLAYDPRNDFAGVSLLGSQPLVVVVNASSGIGSLNDLVARAKANPGKLNYGSGGLGKPQHLATEMLKRAAGVAIEHIPYKGSTGAVSDLLTDQVQMMIEPTATVLPLIESGRLKALAVTSDGRTAQLPDVPTAEEAGLPGLVLTAWYGVLAPAGTPKPYLERLSREIAAIVKRPDVVQSFAKFGATTASSSPKEFDDYLHAQLDLWGKLVRDAQLEPK
jgi:tripartite-type tricarboxylate transporter receptor subunit TctC